MSLFEYTLRVLIPLIFASVFVPSVSAQAQNWPANPVRVVIPMPAGGAGDLLARRLANRLSQKWKQPLVIENKMGGLESIAALAVINAPPDGYTLLIMGEAGYFLNQVQSVENLKPPYDSLTNLTPITRLSGLPLVYVVKGDSPYTSIQSLVAAAKAKPNQISYGTNGPGALIHLAVSQLGKISGAEFLPVHYKGASFAITDLVGGVIDLAPLSLAVSQGFIKEGKARAIGVGGDVRLRALPNVPTLIEQGYNESTQTMYGLAGPAKLPAQLAERIARDTGEVLKEPDFVRDLDAVGMVATPGTPAEFAHYLATNKEIWRQRVAGAKLGK